MYLHTLSSLEFKVLLDTVIDGTLYAKTHLLPLIFTSQKLLCILKTAKYVALASHSRPQPIGLSLAITSGLDTIVSSAVKG